ncbi:ABC transporter ATP-binding protein [Merismopedia glauca]|uniref:ABC transporter ATP-binding protein n=1 Tax=Merismopedia glauca CCAP 1448/3 TaxID=1296344 RepID=A0A2T1C8Z2_9CYAN|nr:ABC transporter ATP-binding protein [Merismopedia glauca]PSB04745.1 ABC transporter ATP-binding protein [Merismopedia glauca CCAP 1448/3]
MSTELAIQTTGLTKQFGCHLAVNNVDLEIASGEVYGLIGPNGAGKTTLIRMLAGAEAATTGEVYINGDRFSTDENHPVIKRQIGYLPDDFPVYEDLTVEDYLQYFARLYQLKEPRRSRRVLEVLDFVQLGHKRKSLIPSLSRGMKQRLSLARTIIHEPILLLLDEPVSGLDPIARQQFREMIKILQAAGMTILISSHVLSDLAELCSSVGVMELGFLVESTSLQNLYQKLSRNQIFISVLDKLDLLEVELKNCPLVRSWERVSDRSLKVEFTGEDAEAADLLRSMIEASIPISQFHTIQESLESIFLKLGHQQPS